MGCGVRDRFTHLFSLSLGSWACVLPLVLSAVLQTVTSRETFFFSFFYRRLT